MSEGRGTQGMRVRNAIFRLIRQCRAFVAAACVVALAWPALAQTAPDEPGNLTATGGVNSVTLHWVPGGGGTGRIVENPEADPLAPPPLPPALPILYYEVRYKIGAGEFGEWMRHDTPDAMMLVVSGLTSAVEHTFELRAANEDGPGPAADAVATPVIVASQGGGGGGGGQGSQDVIPNFEPEFLVSGPDLVFRVGSPAKASLPSAFAATAYAMSPAPPDGLSFNDVNRVISGMPTTAQPRSSYTLTASDEDGEEDTLGFTIEVLPDSVPVFVDTVPDQILRVGTPVELQLPMAVGGDGTLVYDLSPGLPAGLTLDLDSRRITGTPTRPAARTSFTWRVTDEDRDTAAVMFAMEVLPDSMPTFRDSMRNQRFRVGSAVDLPLPRASGGDGEIAYALTPALPAGLSLDGGRPAIVGTPTAVAASTNYAWTATDEDGDAATLTFMIEVQPDSMPMFRDSVEGQIFRVGSAVDVPLPRATGGDGEVVHALTPMLPTGLSVDAARPAIVGTPTVATASTSYAWTATDEDGDTATVTFAIEVEPDLMPTFGASVPDQRYNKTAAIVALVLPNANGGDDPLTYSLSPALPAGLALDMASRTIAGAPSAEFARTEYTWTATDEDGDVAMLTFAIEVGMAVTAAIADVSASEGAALSFPVTISSALPVPVTMSYRTMDGTASAGEDYTAASGTLTFAPGVTQMEIDVNVMSDPLAEHDETFTVALAELVNAEFADDQATGTIVDDDMEAARGEALTQSLAAFGATVAADVVAGVSGRFQEGPPTAPAAGSGSFGVAATVARFFAGASERQYAANPNADLLGGPGATDAFALGGHGARLGDSPGIAAADLLRGGSFLMPFGGAAAGTDRGKWTLWGKAATSRVSTDAGFAVDGRVDTAFLGVDARMPRNSLVGVALARSSAEFDYLQTGVSEGELDLDMTTLLPYVHWTLCNGLDLWAMAGFGNGDAMLVDDLGEARTDTSLRLAATGLRRELAQTETLNWALKADAVIASLRADEVHGALAAADADVQRLRLLVEGRREWAASGNEQTRLGAGFEFGARYDGGDVNNGLGAEVGGALDYRNLPLGLGLEARGRYLLGHSESEFDEWGLSAALELDPGTQGQGASLRLAPAWGAPNGRVADLWRADRMVAENAQRHRSFGGQLPSRLDMEVGYGFASKRTGPVRLFGVLGGGATASYRLGARSNGGNGFGWSVEVDRVRRFGGQTDHGILLSVGNAPAGLVLGMAASLQDEPMRR